MSDPPGWYCYRAVPSLAEWDGTAWTGDTHFAARAPDLPGPPPPFAFLRQSWLWWLVVGQVLVIVPGVVSGTTGSAIWSWTSIVGYSAFMVGTVKVMVRYLAIDRLPRLAGLTVIGVVCGAVGFAVAFGLESLTFHHIGVVATLWLTGPIEEGGKLLVPFALLAFGSSRFKDPLAGLYLVLVSGATTGAVEGAEWQARADYPWFHLQLALVRPAAELPHVFVTGFAGAVIWLAAWRRGRAVNGAGAVAFLIAVAIHSLHDGFITLFGVSPSPSRASIAQSMGQAVRLGVSGAVFATGIGIACFLLGRHAARELTRPGAVGTCPPPWRPQIKTWGCVAPVRVEAPAPPVAVSPYGGPPVAAYGPSPRAPVPVPSVAAVPSSVPSLHPSPAAVPSVAPAGEGAAHPSGLPPGLALLAPPPPPPLPPAPTPAAAPPGWYMVDRDPTRMGWWDGTRWSRPVRWDGIAWRPA